MVFGGRQKDDRRASGLHLSADSIRGFERVVTVQLDIEDDHGEVVFQNQLHGIFTVVRPNQIIRKVAQDGFQVQPIGWITVNQ